MLKVDKIIFSYGKEKILDNVSFELEKNQVLAILGDSGSGKSTLLKIIVGLLKQNQGHLYLDNFLIDNLDCNQRDIGLVFQDYALFPHLNVSQNIGFGIKKNKTQKVKELLSLIKMEDHSNKYPHQLSGGQKQRVAIARSLATNPKILLLDEPFSNLDDNLKQTLRLELKKLLLESEISTIIVTHDINDALALADKIIYLQDGCIKKIENVSVL